LSVQVVTDTSSDPPEVSRASIKLARQAIRDFDLIAEGDRIAVGMSGGKDSAMLLALMLELQRMGDMPEFSIHPVHLDQHQPGFDREGFDRQMERLGLVCEVVSEDTHSIVQEKLKPGQIPCSICGRLRRGILNNYCDSQGYTKLALGHHLDDAIETFLLNLFYGRRLDPLKALTPTTRADVVTIRPMILIEERKIAAWAIQHEVPVIDCPVCDTVPESRRRDLKGVMRQFQSLNADLHASVRTALYENVEASAEP